MAEGKQIKGVVRRRGSRRLGYTSRLGEAVMEFVEKQVSPRQSRFGLVSEVWGQILPAELLQHCEIVDISGGRMKVVADCPAYANELRWCGAELVKELALRCSQARIREIKIVVG